MLKYISLIQLSVLSLVFIYVCRDSNINFSFDFDHYIEVIGIVCMLGVIVYNEFKQSKQLDVISLITLREETHALSSRLDLIQSNLEGNQEVLRSELEHRALRTELLEHQALVNSQLEEFKTNVTANVDDLLEKVQNYVEGLEDEYEKKSTKDSRKKK